MRPIALGRKNWLHLSSQESGLVVAAIMSINASAKRAGHNLRDYLTDVFAHQCEPSFPVTRPSKLLPSHWQPTGAAKH